MHEHIDTWHTGTDAPKQHQGENYCSIGSAQLKRPWSSEIAPCWSVQNVKEEAERRCEWTWENIEGFVQFELWQNFVPRCKIHPQVFPVLVKSRFFTPFPSAKATFSKTCWDLFFIWWHWWKFLNSHTCIMHLGMQNRWSFIQTRVEFSVFPGRAGRFAEIYKF